MRRSTFKILFYVKKSGLKKNGNGVIMGRITIDGEQTQFSTKLEMLPEHWNSDSGKAIINTPNSSDINKQLANIKSSLTVFYNKQMTLVGYATPDKLKRILLGTEEKNHTIISYFEKFNQQYKLQVGTTTTRTTYTKYELTKKRLEEFLNKKYKISDIQLKEITTATLQEFYLFLRKDHNSGNNNAMKNLQRLRSVFNYIKSTGYDDFIDPYLGFKMNFEKHARNYLDQSEIDTIHHKIFAFDSLDRVRDIFIFSCYTGLSYSDISDLTEDNIKLAFDDNLWIMGKRNKTGVKYNVKLFDIPLQIIEKYSSSRKNGKLLPCISNQKTNEYLKNIAELCGIKKNLTFHCGRHKENFYRLLISQLCTICFSIGNDLETSFILRSA